jgi:pimeloyl-ACP methyl ester carboxylesterase
MFVTVGDAKIYTTAFGSTASPVIAGIGGWIGSWELWAEPFALLSRVWRTLAYDHRGAGATVAAVESITFERLVADLFAVLDAYAVEHCVLAAESAGALTALGAALQNPHRITGLVIVDGLYYRATPPAQDGFLLGLHQAYAKTLDHFVEACVPEPGSDHIKRWGRQIIDRASPEAAIALHLAASGIDLRHDLPRITQPTLILHGEADALVSVAEAQQLAKTLPHAQLMLLRGAGHVPTMTRPHEVAGAINRFFGAAIEAP